MLDDLKLKGGVSTTVISTTLNDKGVAILFDIIDDETLTTEAAITDNYIQNNYSVQDHIAIKPKIYRLRGCVGEVVFRSESDLYNWLNKEETRTNHPLIAKTMDAMKPIGAIAPIISNYTQAAINVVKQVESSFNRYKKILNDWKNPSPILNKRQQEVVSILNFILENRLEVSLKSLKYDYSSPELKVNYNSKYFLQSVSSHQAANDFITDIEITIKEVRFTETKVTAIDSKQYGTQSIVADIKTTEVNQGIATTQEPPKAGVEAFKKVIENKDHPIVGKTVQSACNALTINSNRTLAGEGMFSLNKLIGGFSRGVFTMGYNTVKRF